MEGSALFLEMSGLLRFFRRNRTPMGMARVQMALAEAGLRPPALLAPVAFSERAGGLRALDPALLHGLVALAAPGGPAEDPAWQAALDRVQDALAAAPPPPLRPGDRLFLAGLQAPEEILRLRPWQEERGLVLCALFYDAIPLSAPEHVPEDLAESFARLFGLLVLAADRVVAISAHAAREFRLWQRRFLPALDIPVSVMAPDAPFPVALAGALPAPLQDGRRFVLCVSTLEARKDHATLLRAWRTLIRRHGAAAVPDLVLVGREGFGAEPALRLLRGAPELRAKVHWFRSLGDGALAALYRAALFTVFNSFHEGWGLPVTEGLAAGKLVLAPDHSSLREAGGEAALFFPPGDEAALAALAWTLCRDDAHRAALEACLLPRARFRSWREVVEALRGDLLAEAEPALPPPLARRPLPLGWRLFLHPPPTASALPPPGALLPFLLREGEGWGPVEPGGAWLLHPPPGGTPARLRLPLGGPLATARLFLELTAPPVPVTLALRITAPGAPPGPFLPVPLRASEDRVLLLDLPACGIGTILVEFDAAGGASPPGESRTLCALLRAVMLCEASDHDSQLRFFLEHPRCTRLCASP